MSLTESTLDQIASEPALDRVTVQSLPVLSEAQFRELTAKVAYALWEERVRGLRTPDPSADWYQAESLVAESLHQQNGNETEF